MRNNVTRRLSVGGTGCRTLEEHLVRCLRSRVAPRDRPPPAPRTPRPLGDRSRAASPASVPHRLLDADSPMSPLKR